MAIRWLSRKSRPFASGRHLFVSRPRLTVLEDRCVPAVTLTVSPNVDISRLPGNETEAAVAINPTNPNNIVATTVTDSFVSSQWVYRSIDGGNSWTGTPLVAPLVNSAISDGQIRFDRFG